MDFEKFIHDLKQKLQPPLPGTEAQYKMAPFHRQPFEADQLYLQNAKKGSVLLLLYPQEDSANFVLTLRQQYAGVHSGQVSLPGGKKDDSDADFLETALRETQEEVGVLKDAVQVVGKLTQLYIPPSNFLVYPYVGFSTQSLQFLPEETEVAQIIEANVQELLKEENQKIEELTIRGMRFNAPAFNIQGHVVWGATAMILSEFREVLLR